MLTAPVVAATISVCVCVDMYMLGRVPPSVFWQRAGEIRARVVIFGSGRKLDESRLPGRLFSTLASFMAAEES